MDNHQNGKKIEDGIGHNLAVPKDEIISTIEDCSIVSDFGFDSISNGGESSCSTDESILPTSNTIAKRRKKFNRVFSIFLWLLIVLLLLFIVFFNMFTLVNVRGSSMQNTLRNGNQVLLRTSSRNIERGDIIVFEAPPRNNEPQNNIKRVIGIGGDQLLFVREEGRGRTHLFIRKEGNIFSLINEYYLSENNRAFVVSPLFSYYQTSEIANILEPDYIADIIYKLFDEEIIFRVPDDKYFVLGDNRNRSYDSRDAGFIEREKVVGRVRRIMDDDNFWDRFLLFIWGRRARDSV